MGPLSIFALTSFFSEEENSIKKGENHWKSGHVNNFAYSPGVLRGEIDASMKKMSYKVTVSCDFWLFTLSKASTFGFIVKLNFYSCLHFV